MKKWTASAILALCLLLPLMTTEAGAAVAAPTSGTWGDLTWSYNEASKTITISGTGVMSDRPTEIDQYKEKVTQVVIENGATVVGKSAFEGWPSLTMVSLPASVTVIGDNAFNQCTELTQINISSQVRYIGSYAFAETKIREFVIPDNVLEINSHAFFKCVSLEKVTVSPNLIKIGDRAFEKCSALVSVEGLEYVKDIGDYAFYFCSALESIELCPGSVLGEGAFSCCHGPTHLTIPNGCIIESSEIFAACTGIEDVVIEEGVTCIGESLFLACINLKTITIPESVTRIIGDDCLHGCSSLETVNCIAKYQWRAREMIPYRDHLATYAFPSGQIVKKQQDVVGGQTYSTTFTVYWWYNLNTDILNLFVKSTYKSGTISYKMVSTDNFPWSQYVKNGTRVVIDGYDPVYVKTTGVFPEGTVIYNISQRASVQAASNTNVVIHSAIWIRKVDATCSQYGSTAGYQCYTDNCVLPEQLQSKPILPKPHTIEDIPEVPPTSTTTGKDFGKWCAVCGQILLEPLELPAINDKPDPVKTFTVTFDSQGGSTVSSQTVSSGGKAALPDQAPTRADYTFGGWYKENTCTNAWNFDTDTVTEDTTLYAKWTEDTPPTPTKYTVAFDSRGGSAVSSQTVVSGGKAAKPGDPTRVDYTFGGWYREEACTNAWNFDTDTVTEDTTLYAKWTEDTPPTPTKYTVTFDSRGGSAVSSQTVASGGKAVLPDPAPTRADHTFGGWYKEETCTNEWNFDTDTVTEDTTLYAKWTEDTPPTPTKYTVTFDSRGGSTVSSQTVVSGGKAAKPGDPTRADYTFGGWYKEEACTNAWNFDTDTVTEDTTLYARWTEDTPPTPTKYTVTFDANGGSVTPTFRVTDAGGKVTLPTPTRGGYTFDGWFTSASGGERVDNSRVYTSNTTVFAHWTQNSTPAETRYRIYTPGSISGGRYYVSHDTAVQGARITIELSPWSNYELDWISATNLSTGREMDLTRRSRDTYTFVMPAGDVEIEFSYYRQYSGGAYFIPTQPQAKSGPSAWYYKDRHIYHFTSGLVPDGTHLTRDMLVSVLYNLTDHSLDSQTAVGGETGSSTVWASENRIIPNIYDSGLWGTDKALSRDQAALLIFQYAGYRGRDTSQRAGLTQYADQGMVRPIARTAVSWMLASGLMSGTSDSAFTPRGPLTCGETGNILFRFLATSLWTY